MTGDTTGARRDGETAIRLGDRGFAESVLAIVDVAAHDSASARARIDRLRAAMKDPERPTPFEAVPLAFALAAVGDTAAALDALERTEPRGVLLGYLLRGLVALQPSPRLERLLRETQPQ